MDMTTVEIRPAEGGADVMEERGVNLDDVREILVYAEGEGCKLVDGDRCLAKKRIGNFTAYAEYRTDGDAVEVLDVYGHRVLLTEDNQE